MQPFYLLLTIYLFTCFVYSPIQAQESYGSISGKVTDAETGEALPFATVSIDIADEDFNDDTKDAGEMGAGHSVTALYEIVPSNVAYKDSSADIDPLKYQDQNPSKANATANKGEILTVKVRYKEPTANINTKTEHILATKDYQAFKTASENLQWASTVTSFGLKLQNTPLEQDISYNALLEVARKAKGKDANGYRQEMIGMIRKAKSLMKKLEVYT